LGGCIATGRPAASRKRFCRGMWGGKAGGEKSVVEQFTQSRGRGLKEWQWLQGREVRKGELGRGGHERGGWHKVGYVDVVGRETQEVEWK